MIEFTKRFAIFQNRIYSHFLYSKISIIFCCILRVDIITNKTQAYFLAFAFIENHGLVTGQTNIVLIGRNSDLRWTRLRHLSADFGLSAAVVWPTPPRDQVTGLTTSALRRPSWLPPPPARSRGLPLIFSAFSDVLSPTTEIAVYRLIFVSHNCCVRLRYFVSPPSRPTTFSLQRLWCATQPVADLRVRIQSENPYKMYIGPRTKCIYCGSKRYSGFVI